MYPFKFERVYKEKVWGGNRFGKIYNRAFDLKNIGESWELFFLGNESSIISNGAYRGKTLKEIINIDSSGILGENVLKEKFPLFVKIIDAGDDLSVQVHPKGEKSEMWYIIDAPDESYIFLGLNEFVSKRELANYAKNGLITSVLRKIPIKKNDVVNIPSGVIHSLTKGAVVLEIQQNCNTTYRLFDYFRNGLDQKPRQLNIKKAVASLDINENQHTGLVKGYYSTKNDNKITRFVSNGHFQIEKYDIINMLAETADRRKFCLFTCIYGECAITSKHGYARIKAPDTVLIPACLGKYKIEGRCTLIKSYCT